MKLYHGTSIQAASNILKWGIKPRNETQLGNWEEYPSHPGFVYMTTAYALYFAISAMKNDNDKCAIFEIDSDLLRQNRLCPDEDFIGQTRSKHEKISLKEATLESNPLDYRHLMVTDTKTNRKNPIEGWVLSIQSLGNCCYHGKIPLNAITRWAEIDIIKNPYLTSLGLDPEISIINYFLMEKKYTSLMKHIFDGEEVYDEFSEAMNSNQDAFREMIKGRKEFMEKLQSNRENSVKVYNLK